MTWLTVDDLKRFRESIADDATRFLDEEFAEIAAEVAKHDRSRAARLGHRTRKANRIKRILRTNERLAVELRGDINAAAPPALVSLRQPIQ